MVLAFSHVYMEWYAELAADDADEVDAARLDELLFVLLLDDDDGDDETEDEADADDNGDESFIMLLLLLLLLDLDVFDTGILLVMPKV